MPSGSESSESWAVDDIFGSCTKLRVYDVQATKNIIFTLSSLSFYIYLKKILFKINFYKTFFSLSIILYE